MIHGARTKQLLATIIAAAAMASGLGCTKSRAPEPLLANNNVIIILVDTLRADHLAAFGHSVETSPFFDQLITESITFERVIAPASQTVPSMLSLWTGLYPNRHGNQYFAATRSFRVPIRKTKPRVPEHVTLTSERFQKRGYKTGAVVTNPWLIEDFGFDRGFEVYNHMLSVLPFTRGSEVNRAARDLLEKWKNERFFLYLHYMDVHAPYEKEPRYLGEIPTDLSPHPGVAKMLAGYNAEIRAMDDFLRDLIAMVRELGLEENTLIVFASDHGEEFGEHGNFGHGKALYQEVVHVPVLLRHPRLAAMARRIATPVSLVDIAPTILDLTFGNVPPDIDGISLVPQILDKAPSGAPRMVYSELGNMTAAIRDDKKLIRSTQKKNPGQWAYDLTADPKEKTAVASDEIWIRELSEAVDRHVARRFVDIESHEQIDPATEERVRALGY